MVNPPEDGHLSKY